MIFFVFFKVYGDHLDLHVLTHSFPTRRSSDLSEGCDLCRIAFAGSRRRAGGVQRPWRAEGGAGKGGRARTRLYRRDLPAGVEGRSEEHTSELQSLMRISYAVFCLKKKTNITIRSTENTTTSSNHII